MCPTALHGHHTFYPAIRLGLPAGGGLTVLHPHFDMVCGVSVSQFGVPADAEPDPNPPPSPLTARINAPRTVRAGTVLRYSVTLMNRTAKDFPLQPCPSYLEFVYTTSGAQGRYYLNCDYLSARGVRSIAAHRSITFAMHLRVPSRLGIGRDAKFGWQLQGDVGPSAATPLRVTG